MSHEDGLADIVIKAGLDAADMLELPPAGLPGLADTLISGGVGAEDVEIIERRTICRVRHAFGGLPCSCGFHDYGEG